MDKNKQLSLIIILSFCLILTSCRSDNDYEYNSRELLSNLNKNERSKYNSSRFKLLIFFKSNDCRSCLFIIGKLDDEIIRKDKSFYAVGIMPEDDSYPPKKIQKDSNLSFPIIKYKGIKKSNSIFEITPKIIMKDEKGIDIVQYYVFWDNTSSVQNKIIKDIKEKKFLKSH